MKLKQPNTPTECATYEKHCNNIAAILIPTFFLWRTKRKIREYLRSTGATE